MQNARFIGNSCRRQAGISLIELLLVISIVAIIAASATPFLSNFILRNNLSTTTDKVISTFRKAQGYAMDGKNNLVWGVCLFDSSLRLYQDTCASPDFFEDFSIPSSVTVSGLVDTTFSKLHGEPSNILLINISTEIDSSTVAINAVGGMEIN